MNSNVFNFIRPSYFRTTALKRQEPLIFKKKLSDNNGKTVEPVHVAGIGAGTVLEHFFRNGGNSVQETYNSWLSNDRYKSVRDFVLGMRHESLYKLTTEELEHIAASTPHALGDIDGKMIKADRDYFLVRDFDAPYALIHLFHMHLEDRGSCYTWDKVMPFFSSPGIYELFLGILHSKIRYHGLSESRKSYFDAAIQWRIGTAYYSFLRETHLFASLRDRYAIDVKYHILADALFRVDIWHNNTLIELFVDNARFKSVTGGGRKMRTEEIFKSSHKSWRFVPIILPKPRKFGNVSLVGQRNIEKLIPIITGASPTK